MSGLPVRRNGGRPAWPSMSMSQPSGTLPSGVVAAATLTTVAAAATLGVAAAAIGAAFAGEVLGADLRLNTNQPAPATSSAASAAMRPPIPPCLPAEGGGSAGFCATGVGAGGGFAPVTTGATGWAPASTLGSVRSPSASSFSNCAIGSPVSRDSCSSAARSSGESEAAAAFALSAEGSLFKAVSTLLKAAGNSGTA